MDKCYRIKSGLGPIKIDLNPVVTIVSIIFIWGFIAWAIAAPEHALNTLQGWQKWVTITWTWLYIGTQDIWFVFVVYLFCSKKYGTLKLGKDDEKPEFSDVTYFTMLFAAGIGIGLFYFGVAEPVYHYAPGVWGNRYYQRYSDNQQAQDAMNLTFFHWGIHGWIVYVIVGLLLGIIAHRNRLPMTMKTCFYPLIGDRAFGLFGDVIDIISVVATMFGVCTSLGLGAVQFNQGLHRIIGIQMSITNQLIIIWCITCVATASVVSGVKLGIRRLSELCFGLGMFIMFIIFFIDDTWHFLNVFTQSTGYYFQYIIQLGFHTDAYAQLGNAPDGKEAPNWMNSWTIFYWGWWIAWSPFVGMFVARISKGRTVREFVAYTLICPAIYMFMWFSIFGSIGIKMEREAIHANITCDSVLGGKNASKGLNGIYRLSCRGSDDMFFDVLEQYSGVTTFLSCISIIGLLLYFVTSSDSGSLVIDCLSANGDQDPPIIQRIFWALTEGACATALLYAGGSKALHAMQALNICTGLFYTMILNFMCVALWRAMRRDLGIENPEIDPKFSTDLIDPIFISPKSKPEFLKHAMAFLVPWYGGGKACHMLYGGSNKQLYGYMAVLAVPWYIWIIITILWILELIIGLGMPVGVMYIGWAVLMGFFFYLTGTRSLMREKFKINGNLAEDFFVCMLGYPLAIIQMQKHMEYWGDIDYAKKNDPNQQFADDGCGGKVPPIDVVYLNGMNRGGQKNPAFKKSNEELKL